MADFFTVAASRMHAIPDNFTTEEASLIEPLATPVHAARLVAEPKVGLMGKAVVIIGAGTIGLLMLAVVRRLSASKIVVTDPVLSKRVRAKRLGADVVIDSEGGKLTDAVLAALGESADFVFDCVANQATVDVAVKLATKAGVVVIIGVPSETISVSVAAIQEQQIRVQGSATYVRQDYLDAMDVISDGYVHAAEMITATFDLADAARAFSAASTGEHVKVLVRP